MTFVAWCLHAAGPPLRPGRVLSTRHAHPSSTAASNGVVTHTSRFARMGAWIKLDRSQLPRPTQRLCHHLQCAQRSRLRCRTVEILLPRQLLLVASGSGSRFGRAVVVSVHPRHRQRLDPEWQVKLFVHPVLLEVFQVHHARSVAAETRRAHVIAGSHCLPIQLWLLAIFRDLRLLQPCRGRPSRPPMARVLFGRGVCGDSLIVAFPSGRPGDLGLVGLTGVFAPGISPADVTACQPVMRVRLLSLAELDRPLEVVSQNSRPPVAEVISRAPREQECPRLSQQLIYLLNLLRQVSDVAHDTHLVSSTVLEGISVFSRTCAKYTRAILRNCCTVRSAASLDSCEPVVEIWHSICSALPSAMTLSLTDATRVRMAGSPSLTNNQPRMAQLPDPRRKSCHSLSVFRSLRRSQCSKDVCRKTTRREESDHRLVTHFRQVSVVTRNDWEHSIQRTALSISVRRILCPTLHARLAPCRSREMCQLVACHFFRSCRTASISGAWSRITRILRDGRELSKFCRLGQRFKLLVLRAHTCTAVDQQKLSVVVVVDPYQQIPQTTNTRQWRDGSPWPCATRLPALERSCHRLSPSSPLIRSSNVHRQLQTSRELRLQSAAHASGGHSVHAMSEYVCWLFAE